MNNKKVYIFKSLFFFYNIKIIQKYAFHLRNFFFFCPSKYNLNSKYTFFMHIITNQKNFFNNKFKKIETENT